MKTAAILCLGLLTLLAMSQPLMFSDPVLVAQAYAATSSAPPVTNVWPAVVSSATRIDTAGTGGAGYIAGCRFTATSTVTVTALGFTNCATTNVQLHTLALYTLSGGTTNLRASVMVASSGVGLAKVWGTIPDTVITNGSTNWIGVTTAYGDRWIEIGAVSPLNGIATNIIAQFGNCTFTNPARLTANGPTPAGRQYGGVYMVYR